MEIAHARAAEVKTKRRKLDSGELLKSENLNQCSCLIDSPDNSTSLATTSVTSDQTPAHLDELCDNSSRSAQIDDSEANNSTLVNSRELTADVMETTTTKKKKTMRKASSAQAQQPSMAEIEEFFSVAEKYEAKRFAEKYNFDIVKDVPLQGKYRWVRIEQ